MEGEVVDVVGDQPVGEAHGGAHVVDHRAAGLAEGVVRAPARGAAVAVGRALEQLDAQVGSAHWRAHYTFSQTGRAVVNDVRATMRFADGLIADHVDAFDFHRWARQALGTRGLLLGWTPLLRNAVRRRARAGLDEYLAR